MTRKKQKQTLAAGPMFETDDLPLFSGTPATASDSPFMPEAAPEPDAPTVDMFSDPEPETHGAQWGGSSAEARVSFGTYYLINFETGDAVVSTRMEHGERLLRRFGTLSGRWRYSWIGGTLDIRPVPGRAGPPRIGAPYRAIDPVRELLATGHGVLLLCACRSVSHCHRGQLADYLAETLALDVIHLS